MLEPQLIPIKLKLNLKKQLVMTQNMVRVFSFCLSLKCFVSGDSEMFGCLAKTV